MTPELQNSVADESIRKVHSLYFHVEGDERLPKITLLLQTLRDFRPSELTEHALGLWTAFLSADEAYLHRLAWYRCKLFENAWEQIEKSVIAKPLAE